MESTLVKNLWSAALEKGKAKIKWSMHKFANKFAILVCLLMKKNSPLHMFKFITVVLNGVKIISKYCINDYRSSMFQSSDFFE